MEQSQAIVRKGKREDMTEVHEMIKELAEFEKMEDRARIDALVLQQDGFDSEHPSFSTFVAENFEGHIIGYALYYLSYSTWVGKCIFLEDLYVRPSFRKKGVGRKLFMAVAQVAYETGNRFKFHVLSWNPAIEFYKGLGAVDLTSKEEWHLFRLDKISLNKLFSK